MRSYETTTAIEPIERIQQECIDAENARQCLEAYLLRDAYEAGDPNKNVYKDPLYLSAMQRCQQAYDALCIYYQGNNS